MKPTVKQLKVIEFLEQQLSLVFSLKRKTLTDLEHLADFFCQNGI